METRLKGTCHLCHVRFIAAVVILPPLKTIISGTPFHALFLLISTTTLDNSSSTLLEFPPLTRDLSQGTSSVIALYTRRTKEEMASRSTGCNAIFSNFPSSLLDQKPVSRKFRGLFGPEKLVVKLQSACFEELIF